MSGSVPVTVRQFVFPAALLLYHLLFWKTGTGVNIFLFDLVIFAAWRILIPESFKSRKVLWSSAATFLCSIMYVIFHSAYSGWMHGFSLIVLSGFVFQPSLNTVYQAACQTFINLLLVPLHWAKTGREKKSDNARSSRIFYWFRLSIVPFLVVVVFYVIYNIASPNFYRYNARLWEELTTSAGEGFDFYWFPFILLGVVILSTLLINTKYGRLAQSALRATEVLKRVKSSPLLRFKFPALRKEFRSSLILIAMMNLLLLAFNTGDLKWIWLRPDYNDLVSFSSFVHEGTFMLIVSILLSMGILLWFFRGNLSFISSDKWLKGFSYAWIIQNGFLTLSVGMRNVTLHSRARLGL